MLSIYIEMENDLNKFCSKNKIFVQIFEPNGEVTVKNYKSLNEVSKSFNIPYSTLINIYYICTNKGGGKNKLAKKKYIHGKYVELLKHIRVFDNFNEDLMNNKDYFESLLGN
jgi:hypothetical protein